ncbi:MAG TPA: GDP-mannose 4,6-dehydratase [Solirubrobacteraceae bacterium]|jgi:GDPmannose 4,6-dehydratase
MTEAGTQSPRRALLTGLTGQDGSYLAELLLEKGYEVIGIVRKSADGSLGSAEHLRGSVSLREADLLEPESLATAVAELQPDELYHLAAPSFVPASWQAPAETLRAIVGATATLLVAVREQSPQTRAFIAASGAMFGAAPESPQHEDTPRFPLTPYATAKLAAHQLTGQLRAHDGIFACSGILYNHESERRPESFVTRKITKAAAEVKLGLASEVVLGDLSAIRDWSFAGDIVQGMWLMLQQEQPGDCILASGVAHTVAELADAAFAHVGLSAKDHIQVDESLMRASEGTPQVGDPSRAKERLGWQPTVSFEQLVGRMVESDLQELQAHREPV